MLTDEEVARCRRCHEFLSINQISNITEIVKDIALKSNTPLPSYRGEQQAKTLTTLKQFADNLQFDIRIRTFANRSSLIQELGLDYSLFSVTPSSKNYSLMPWHIDGVKRVFDDLELNSKIILDGTAHIGVDTVFFSKYYPSTEIISCEIDKKVFDKLNENIKKFNLKNVKTHLTSVIDFLITNETKFDFIYFDPPWGDDYPRIRPTLAMSGKSIYDIVNIALRSTNLVILKTPPEEHFSSENFLEQLSLIINENYELTFDTFEIMNGNQVSYKLYIIQKTN